MYGPKMSVIKLLVSNGVVYCILILFNPKWITKHSFFMAIDHDTNGLDIIHDTILIRLSDWNRMSTDSEMSLIWPLCSNNPIIDESMFKRKIWSKTCDRTFSANFSLGLCLSWFTKFHGFMITETTKISIQQTKMIDTRYQRKITKTSCIAYLYYTFINVYCFFCFFIIS